MNKIYLSSVALAAMMFSGNVMAVDSSGGCGLGSMAWRGQSGIGPQVAAMTTNTTFMNTFGVTFGTSGCDPEGRVTGGTGRIALAFIENNMDQFAMDASVGHGETIDTLAGILNVDKEKLGQVSKENFATIFSNENTDAVFVTLAMLELNNIKA